MTNKIDLLKPLLLPHVTLQEVEREIYTTSLVQNVSQGYNASMSAYYDKVVGNRFYNRLLWGNWPTRYQEFARTAMQSAPPNAPCLDAGCGSLVFTAEVYRYERQCPLILLDSSIEMLRGARQKLEPVPENMVLLVGNIFNLPFQSGAFATVMSFGMLHLFDDVTGMVKELLRVSVANGHCYLTSLVTDRWLGAKYLAMIQRAGEVARPKSSREIQQILGAGWHMEVTGNMAYLSR